MSNSYYTIKKGLQVSLSVFALLMGTLITKAQTLVTAPMTGTPAAGQYYSTSSITLSPGFSFSGSSGNLMLNIFQRPASNLSATQNYILTSIPRVPGYSLSTLVNYTVSDVNQTVEYFDGLGRPLQTVQVQGSPAQKDVVQPIAYDPLGREAIKYLPYAVTGTATSDGSYKPTAITDQSSFYVTPPAGVSAITYANAQTGFEPSPLNRVVEQGAPGTAWQLSTSGISGSGHTVKLSYTANNSIAFTSDSVNSMQVALYNVTINADQSRTLVPGGYYAANQLYVTISKDENWVSGRAGTTEEYKDKEGRVVLKRTYNYTTSLQRLSTYYVYDDMGNLAFVLPPAANGDAAAAISQTTLNNLCYQYQYDGRNRLSQKKLPGKGAEYTVYNIIDQPVATQDANQRTANQWMITKYDGLGRVIMSGIWNNNNTAILPGTLQATITGITTNLFETTTATGNGYTNVAWPTTGVTATLSTNYYDNYNIPGLPATYTLNTGVSQMTRGLLTAKKTAVLNNPADQLWDVIYYDDLGRQTKTYAQHYLGGTANTNNYDLTTTTYNFNNQPTTVTRQHYNTASTTVPRVTIANTYGYDHVGRKLKTFESINGGTNILLSQSDYNEIGQLMTKHLHSATGVAPFLQDISYTYNERGWLKTINNPTVAPTATKLFAEQLNYNTPQYGATPQYNGNIAEQDYNAGISTRQHVSYGYDKLNRLLSGNSTTTFSETGISYDQMGNILGLTRANNGALNYTYTGNQLTSLSGYISGTNAYDANGNLQTDGTRGATINYNLLNLPQTVTAAGLNITYTYDASGMKLRKVSNGTSTDYISGIQYKPDAATIDFIQTEEGRTIWSGTTYNYEYTLTDHLGNNRVAFDQTNGKVGEDDYYPFGLNVHRQVNAGNRYLYNRKELQEELGTLDYGARFYDPVIGRTTTQDPMAEKFFPLSPYSYAANNPILVNDPSGKDWTINMDVDKDGVTHFHILFTGAVVDKTKDHKGQANQLAKSITSQFQSLFNQDKSKGDGEGGTGFTVDATAQIRAIGSEDDVATNETLFKVEDANNDDLKYTDGNGQTGVVAAKALNGKEIAVNEDDVSFFINGDGKKTLTHEIAHTGGLRHPADDSGIFGGAGHGLDKTRNFMNPGGRFGDPLNKTPTGPTRDQLYHIYELYRSDKLNKKDVQPIDQ